MSNLTEYETDPAYKLTTAVATSTDTAEGHNIPDSTKNTESKASEPVFDFDPELERVTPVEDRFAYKYTTPFSEGRLRRVLLQSMPEGDSMQDFLPPLTDDRLKHFAETFSVPEDDEAHTKLSHMISWAASELLWGHPYYRKVVRDGNLEPSQRDQVKQDFFENGTATDLPGLKFELPKDPRLRVTEESLFSLAEKLMAAFARLPGPKDVQVTAKTPALSSSVPSEAT